MIVNAFELTSRDIEDINWLIERIMRNNLL